MLRFFVTNVCLLVACTGGELTETLKLKRGPAADKHSDIIEALYYTQ